MIILIHKGISRKIVCPYQKKCCTPICNEEGTTTWKEQFSKSITTKDHSKDRERGKQQVRSFAIATTVMERVTTVPVTTPTPGPINNLYTRVGQNSRLWPLTLSMLMVESTVGVTTSAMVRVTIGCSLLLYKIWVLTADE
jgi:hypothetical protein